MGKLRKILMVICMAVICVSIALLAVGCNNDEYALKTEVDAIVSQLQSAITTSKTETNTQIATLKAEYDVKITVLTKDVSANEQAIATLKAEYAAKVALIEKQANDDKAELKTVLDASKADLQQKIDTLQTKHDADVKALQNADLANKAALLTEIDGIKANIKTTKDALDTLQTEYDKHIEDIDIRLKEMKDELLASTNSSVSDLQNQLDVMNDEMSELQEKFEEADVTNKAELQAQIDNLSGTIAQTQTQLDTLQTAYQAKVAEIETKATADKEELTANLNAAKTELQVQISNLDSKYAQKVQELVGVDQELQNQIDELTANLNTEKQALATEITRVENEYKSAVEEIETTVANNKTQLEIQLNTAKQELQAQYDALEDKTEEAAEELQANIDALQTAYQAKVAEIEAKAAADKTELANALNSAKTELQVQISNLDSKYAQKVQELVGIDQELQNQIDELTANLNTEKQALATEIARVENEYKAAVEVLETSITASINALKVEKDANVIELQGQNNANKQSIIDLKKELDEKIESAESKCSAKEKDLKEMITLLQSSLENMINDNSSDIEENKDAIAELQDQVAALIAGTYHTVKFDTVGTGTIENQTIRYGAKATRPAQPSKDGFEFIGWFVGDELWSFAGDSVTQDITLVAKYQKIVLPKTYTVTFNSNGGSNIEKQIVIEGQKVVRPQDPTRTGYVFIDWYVGEERWSFIGYVVTEDIVLTAKWGSNEFVVTFDLNGGYGIDQTSMTVFYDEIYEWPIVNKTGYVFDCWLDESGVEVENGVWKYARNTTLTAKWEPRTDTAYVVNHYKQNSNNDEYMLFETQNLTGTTDAEIAPAVNNYEGFSSPALQTTTINPDGGTIVNYYYTRNSYQMSYVVNGGETIETETIKYQSNISLKEATREGYTFGGWFADETLDTEYSMETMPGENQVVYAWWVEENKPSDFAYSDTLPLTIYSYKGDSTSLCIPSHIGGIPVEKIDVRAFKDISFITKVVVPDTVTAIGEGAFQGCNSIEEITLPFVGSSSSGGSVPYYDRVFGFIFGYDRVEYTFDIPSDAVMQYMKSYSDYYCYYIPDSIKTVKITGGNSICGGNGSGAAMGYAFKDCASIQTIILSDTITTISDTAFSGCTNLTNITIGKSTEKIGKSAFSGCTNLTNIVYTGSISDWKKIELGSWWCDDVKATKVTCIDGPVNL